MQMREPREMRCPAWLDLDPRHSLARQAQGKGCDMEGCLGWGEVTLMSCHLTNQSQHTRTK